MCFDISTQDIYNYFISQELENLQNILKAFICNLYSRIFTTDKERYIVETFYILKNCYMPYLRNNINIPFINIQELDKKISSNALAQLSYGLYGDYFTLNEKMNEPEFKISILDIYI